MGSTEIEKERKTTVKVVECDQSEFRRKMYHKMET